MSAEATPTPSLAVAAPAPVDSASAGEGMKEEAKEDTKEEAKDDAKDDAKDANTTLTAKAAIEIFVAKHSHTSRDALSVKLALDYGITSKSVRGALPVRKCHSVHVCLVNALPCM